MFGTWALRAAWRFYGDRRIVLAYAVSAVAVVVGAMAVDAASDVDVSWLDVVGSALILSVVAPYVTRGAMALVLGLVAFSASVSGPVGRAGAHFWADLERGPYRSTAGVPLLRALRMVVFSPAPALRLTLVVAPLGVVGWAMGTAAPAASSDALEATWVWSVLASAGLALVFGLRACGVRYRHPVDPGMGGGSSVIAATIAAASLSGGIVLGARPSGACFALVGLAVGAFVAAVGEALIRGPRGVGLRVARVPLGYERDLLFLPKDGDRWQVWIEHRVHLDPLYDSAPDDHGAPSRTLLPHPEDARETYPCDPRDGNGFDAIARGIIFAFWGIEQPHVADVRRVAWTVLKPVADGREFRVAFSQLIDAGVGSEPDVEVGRVAVWPDPPVKEKPRPGRAGIQT